MKIRVERKIKNEENKSQTFTAVQYFDTNKVTYKSVNCSITYIVFSITAY